MTSGSSLTPLLQCYFLLRLETLKNCSWNSQVYSSLCSLLSLWIAELLMGLTLSQKFRWWRVAWSTESKRKKSFFPLWPYFLTASLFPPCLLFFAPSPLSERWNRLAGASLACGHEKDGHQNYDFLFQGSRAGITVLPYISRQTSTDEMNCPSRFTINVKRFTRDSQVGYRLQWFGH